MPRNNQHSALSAEQGVGNVAAATGVVLEKVSIQRGEHVLFSSVTESVGPGEVLAVVGPSGIGKSSLLEAVRGDLAPIEGSIHVAGRIPPLPRKQRKDVALIPQEPRMNADPRLTLAETVAAPVSFARGRLRPRAQDLNERALTLWERVHLEHELLDRFPHEVSDGQLQRALVVRGLSRPAQILLADEPTSALDTRTAEHVWDAIEDAVHADQAAAVVVSHDAERLIAMARSTVRLHH